MQTIAVVSRKGGSGKTTISTQLAIGLWRRGRRVMLADNDIQASSLEVFRMRTQPGPDRTASTGSKLFTLQNTLERDGYDILVVDTPAVIESETAQVVARADLALMVLRPTYLDLAAAVNTSQSIRQLRRPGLIVLNQAPTSRGDIESPMVRRALEAVRLLEIPVAPTVIRLRMIHQVAVSHGLSAEEVQPDAPGGMEIGRLCDYLDAWLKDKTAPQAKLRSVAQV
jgi:chromosome partitioning protein